MLFDPTSFVEEHGPGVFFLAHEDAAFFASSWPKAPAVLSVCETLSIVVFKTLKGYLYYSHNVDHINWAWKPSCTT